MKIKTKEVRKVVSLLDNIIKEYKQESTEKKRDWRTHEQRVSERLKKSFKELKPLVTEAAKSIKMIKGESRGSKPLLTLEQKVLCLLLKHLIGKSNRNMGVMLIIFSWLTDISVSYKTIERLYSDEEVALVLYNLHILILKKKDIKQADCAGDCTGYTLTVKKHYASEVQKLKDKIKSKSNKKHKKTQFVYSFALMDIKSHMHISYGTSFKSETEAFTGAVSMAKEINIEVDSIRLDRYYSAQSKFDFCQKKKEFLQCKNLSYS